MARFLGEFEQMVLLAILQQAEKAFGLEIRREIERGAGREVSRGAFYTTLDRLGSKGYIRWSEERPSKPGRRAPLRHFSVTLGGLAALRASRRAVATLSRGLESILEES
jgi:DNA-binding PadR family transcriptional regulator